MCRWILEAWRFASQDTIAKSFNVTGISNKMDGIEAGLLCHPFTEESCQENAIDSEGDQIVNQRTLIKTVNNNVIAAFFTQVILFVFIRQMLQRKFLPTIKQQQCIIS
jgi:hypothetical protein